MSSVKPFLSVYPSVQIKKGTNDIFDELGKPVTIKAEKSYDILHLLILRSPPPYPNLQGT